MADIESLSLEDTLAYLSEIESLCRQRRLRLTVPRREVLQALLERGKPLSAYDLVASLAPLRAVKHPLRTWWLEAQGHTPTPA